MRGKGQESGYLVVSREALEALGLDATAGEGGGGGGQGEGGGGTGVGGGGGGEVWIREPCKASALFDMRSTLTGEALEGLAFSEAGRVLTRVAARRSKDPPPIVTWGTSLLTGANSRENPVACWALQVTRQTGRWFVGFIKPPPPLDYGVVIEDMATDGCVLGNFGAVYRTHTDYSNADVLRSTELPYQLPYHHMPNLIYADVS